MFFSGAEAGRNTRQPPVAAHCMEHCTSACMPPKQTFQNLHNFPCPLQFPSSTCACLHFISQLQARGPAPYKRTAIHAMVWFLLHVCLTFCSKVFICSAATPVDNFISLGRSTTSPVPRYCHGITNRGRQCNVLLNIAALQTLSEQPCGSWCT